VIEDCGYDSDDLIKSVEAHGMKAAFPQRKNCGAFNPFAAPQIQLM